MPQEAPFSLTQGMTFEFEDNGQRIRAWFSHWSGREVISVNGQAISSKWQFGRDCTHPFRIGADAYSVNMKMATLSKGPFICTLSKNGVPRNRQILALVFANRCTDSVAPTAGKRIASFLSGAGVWMIFFFVLFRLRTHFHIPAAPFYSVLAVVITTGVLYQSMRSKRVTATIEEEDFSPR